MKKIYTILFCTAALAWGGCSDDDNDIDLSQLVGKWELVKIHDGEYDEWDEEYGEAYGYISTNEFHADGTGKRKYLETYEGQTDVSEHNFTYTVQGKTITIVDDDDESYSYCIEKLTGNELILTVDYEGEDGKRYTDKEYFKRIG